MCDSRSGMSVAKSSDSSMSSDIVFPSDEDCGSGAIIFPSDNSDEGGGTGDTSVKSMTRAQDDAIVTNRDSSVLGFDRSEDLDYVGGLLVPKCCKK